jgi:glutamate dehydrogenase/leucine dehydrogenase
VIDKNNAGRIKARFIMEMANGPITAEADEKLNRRRQIIIPDILANGGGVTVSYFEWLQNIQGEQWTEAVVNQKLAKVIKEALQQVMVTSQKMKVGWRLGAYVLALKRITQAIEDRR